MPFAWGVAGVAVVGVAGVWLGGAAGFSLCRPRLGKGWASLTSLPQPHLLCPSLCLRWKLKPLKVGSTVPGTVRTLNRHSLDRQKSEAKSAAVPRDSRLARWLGSDRTRGQTRGSDFPVLGPDLVLHCASSCGLSGTILGQDGVSYLTSPDTPPKLAVCRVWGFCPPALGCACFFLALGGGRTRPSHSASPAPTGK